MGIHISDPGYKVTISGFWFTIQNAIKDVTTVWLPDTASAWFAIHEAQFRLYRIVRQDLRFVVLTEEISIIGSDDLLGPMLDTPSGNFTPN